MCKALIINNKFFNYKLILVIDDDERTEHLVKLTKYLSINYPFNMFLNKNDVNYLINLYFTHI
jgi:hypothetical protein